MKNNLKANSHFLMGFEIKTQSSPVLKPTSIHIWDQSSNFAEFTPQEPLHFKNDVLVGLELLQLIRLYSQPGLQNSFDHDFINTKLKQYCPYTPLFENSQQKLKSLDYATQFHAKSESKSKLFQEQFRNFMAINIFNHDLQKSFKLNLNSLTEVIEMINSFESLLKKNLLYNFELSFETEFNNELISLYSFLFHLRSLVALDFNTQIDDTSLQALKCDSISDYLPRADFTTNDALVYLNFKKLSKPFVDHKDRDIRIEKLFVQPLQKVFEQYNHNACLLIENLPQSAFEKKSNDEIENSLHQIQMDWLLGSSAGLLFKIREELYALKSGYNKIFWPDAPTVLGSLYKTKNSSIKYCFELNKIKLQKAG